MSKYEENLKLLSDLEGLPKNIVEMAVAGANRNLKLSYYYVLGSSSKLLDKLDILQEMAKEIMW
jgi:hypothetical protein